jgi:hypothetical protein
VSSVLLPHTHCDGPAWNCVGTVNENDRPVEGMNSEDGPTEFKSKRPPDCGLPLSEIILERMHVKEIEKSDQTGDMVHTTICDDASGERVGASDENKMSTEQTNFR